MDECIAPSSKRDVEPDMQCDLGNSIGSNSTPSKWKMNIFLGEWMQLPEQKPNKNEWVLVSCDRELGEAYYWTRWTGSDWAMDGIKLLTVWTRICGPEMANGKLIK